MTIAAQGLDRQAVGGFLPCIVSIDGGRRYRVQATVPSGTGDLTAVTTWLNTNVSAAQEAAWAAHAAQQWADQEVEAAIPEDWLRSALDEAAWAPILRASMKEVFNELRVVGSTRSNAQFLDGILARLST